MPHLAVALLLPALVASVPFKRQSSNRHSIRIGSQSANCLSVVNSLYDGAKVVAADCLANDARDAYGNRGPLYHNTWEIFPGSGAVRIAGTSFCLDAGENPHNNVDSKIWTCYDGLPQQTWYLTDDARIAITGGDQCLDNGPSGPQTYACTPYNDNQVWLVQDPVVSGSVATATASATAGVSSAPGTVISVTATGTASGSVATATSGSLFPPNAPGGSRLHPNGDESLCLTVSEGYVAQAQPISISSCFDRPADGSASYANNQLWDISRGEGMIKLHNSNYCIDFSSTPANGVGAVIWNCHDVPQERLFYTDDNRIANVGGDQCLDVVADSGPKEASPYGSLKNVQTWQCSNGNTQQIWTSSS